MHLKCMRAGIMIAGFLFSNFCFSYADEITCEFSELPGQVVERSNFRVMVEYDLENTNSVYINCEMKNASGTILQAFNVPVSGAGEKTFSFTAPELAGNDGLIMAVWLGEDWRNPLCPIQFSLRIPIEKDFHDPSLQKEQESSNDSLTSAESVRGISIEKGKKGNIAVYRDQDRHIDPVFSDALASHLRKAGMGVTFLDSRQICDKSILRRDNFFLLVLPDSKVFPGNGQDAFFLYLKQGGNVLCFNGPPFEFPSWKTADSVFKQSADVSESDKPDSKSNHQNVLFGFEAGVAGWSRTANAGHSVIESDLSGTDGTGRCAKVTVDNLQGWDCYYSVLNGIIPKKNNNIYFWAKGDANTSQLVIEGTETDQSRWFKVVQLETNWKFFIFSDSDFSMWANNPGNSRGRPGDKFKLCNTAKLMFGVAIGQTTTVAKGSHVFWIDEIGTELGISLDLEALAPLYKFYQMKDLKSAVVESNQAFINSSLKISVPEQAWSCVNRPRAIGYQPNTAFRWIPLVYAVDKIGATKGTLAYLYLNSKGKYKGSLWGTFGILKEEFLSNPSAMSAFIEVADRLSEGVYILKGGAEKFSYFPDQTSIKLGMSIGNFSKEEKKLTARILVFDKKSQLPIYKDTKEIVLDAGGSDVFKTVWEAVRFNSEKYTVRVELLKDGKVIDLLVHEIGILPWTPDSVKDYVSVKNGDFWLNGVKWYPVGLNYWPLYVSGINAQDYKSHWLSKGNYDPALVEPDLKQLKDMGVTAISIAANDVSQIDNTLDFLRMCRLYGIHANVYIGNNISLIKQARYDLVDTIFAYDIDWEPVWGTYDGCYGSWWGGRKNRENEWKSWVIEKYGSTEKAERDWKYSISTNEKFPAPSDMQLNKEGDWIRYVAAYRRFVDDYVSRQYWDVNRNIKDVDAHHLVSFRMNSAGDVWADPSQCPLDFRGLAKVVDFFGPEGYSFSWGGERMLEKIRGGLFTATYARYANQELPIVWTEFGMSVRSSSSAEYDLKLLEKQGVLWSNLFIMMLDSQANGGLGWWYPGGYRVDEKSDFGIVSPDHSLYPAGKALAEYVPVLTKPREIPKPNKWFTIDRDRYCNGYIGIFNSIRDQYFEAVKSGQVPGFKSEGSDTDSVNTSMLAVGNTKYNHSNPVKYLNSIFMHFKIKTVDGWKEVGQGKQYRIRSGEPVLVTATIGNTGDATWVSPANADKKEGGVYLVSTRNSEIKVKVGINGNVPYLGDAVLPEFVLAEKSTIATILRNENKESREIKIELEMCANKRCTFGERLVFSLVVE